MRSNDTCPVISKSKDHQFEKDVLKQIYINGLSFKQVNDFYGLKFVITEAYLYQALEFYKNIFHGIAAQFEKKKPQKN